MSRFNWPDRVVADSGAPVATSAAKPDMKVVFRLNWDTEPDWDTGT